MDRMARAATTRAGQSNQTSRRSAHMNPADPDDPYLWLEDVLGDDQLNWVRSRNDPTVA